MIDIKHWYQQDSHKLQINALLVLLAMAIGLIKAWQRLNVYEIAGISVLGVFAAAYAWAAAGQGNPQIVRWASIVSTLYCVGLVFTLSVLIPRPH